MNDIVDLRKFLVHWTNLSDLQRKDVSHQNKIRIGWCAFLFVLFHTVTIIVYAFPAGYIPRSLQSASAHYVQPVFEQTWSLFAPCPVNDGKIEVKYYFEDDSTDWINPLKEQLEIHSRLRFTHHGELAIGYSNLLFYVANDLQVKGLSIYEPFPPDSTAAYRTTSSYWLMRQFIYGISDFTYGKYPVRALAKCHYRNVKTKEEGTLLLPEFNWEKND